VATVHGDAQLRMLAMAERRKSNTRSMYVMFAAVPFIIGGAVFAAPSLVAAGIIAELGGAVAFVKTA
jgi:hypothetical protein